MTVYLSVQQDFHENTNSELLQGTFFSITEALTGLAGMPLFGDAAGSVITQSHSFSTTQIQTPPPPSSLDAPRQEKILLCS